MHGRATSTPTAWPAGRAADAAGLCRVEDLRLAIDARLSGLSARAEGSPAALNAAVRHALLAPGKRVRPLLAVLTALQFGADPARALDAGCAIELVHTASLVLDDLPCMDDASTRRGIATTHRAYGQATAMLAAIAMLTRAFQVLALAEDLSPEVRIDLTGLLSHAAGSEGLTAGQERDLTERTPTDPLDKINSINHQKTGALFIAALQMGGRIADADDACMAALANAGREIGLAFQALDDVIDMSRSPMEAGKDTGKDVCKATVASVMGLDAARALVFHHVGRAHAALEPYAPAGGPLRTFIAAMFEKADHAAKQPAA